VRASNVQNIDSDCGQIVCVGRGFVALLWVKQIFEKMVPTVNEQVSTKSHRYLVDHFVPLAFIRNSKVVLQCFKAAALTLPTKNK